MSRSWKRNILFDMESSSAAFRRFMSLPDPFSDDSPCKSALVRKGLSFSPVSPPGDRSWQKNPVRTSLFDDGEDVITEKLKSSRISFDDMLLDCDESSRDSGFISEDSMEMDAPQSLTGLMNNPLLSPSAPVRRSFSDGSCTPGIGESGKENQVPRTKKCRKGLFQSTTRPFASLENTPTFAPQSRKSTKRPSPSQNVDNSPVTFKKQRSLPIETSEISPRRTLNKRSQSESLIKSALEHEQSSEDLTGDFSRPYCLPIIPGKHKDLKSISPETMSALLANRYDDVVDQVTVVDCRYPYEFDGGHIEGAINVWERDSVYSHFLQNQRIPSSTGTKRNVIVFHCEFSSERGPRMSRFLRKMDREANKESYPALFHPEVYLLEGGYKAFYETSKIQCEPSSYLPMAHKDYLSELKHFRIKSKTWAGEKTSKSRRTTLRQLKL